MHLSRFDRSSDVECCVDMYMALDDGFMPVDRDTALKSLRMMAIGKFARLVRDMDGQPIAFLCAAETKLPHSNAKILQQIYYASNQKGMRSTRCVRILHDALFHHGVGLGVDYVTSPGSHLDPDFIFARILERSGWERRGYLAIRKVK